MRSVGVRELRQRASELLRLVEAGERIEVTDHGRPVGVLIPVPEDPRERMQASGELTAATASHRDLPDPLPLPAGAEPPSRVLERLREDER